MCVESTRDKVVRILFLIKLQMAVEAEPKLPERLGREIRWEDVRARAWERDRLGRILLLRFQALSPGNSSVSLGDAVLSSVKKV